MLSSGGASVASTFTSYRHRPPPVLRLTITSTMARNGFSGSRDTYARVLWCLSTTGVLFFSRVGGWGIGVGKPFSFANSNGAW